jgi:aspartate 1-decarboxylase
MLKILLISGAIFVVACMLFIFGYHLYPIWNETSVGFADRQEWSIVHIMDKKYEDADNSEFYFIEEVDIKNVNNNSSIVAFPIKGKTKGYVVILSKATVGATVKVSPIVDFELTKEIYEEIKSQITLYDDVDTFIASHIIDESNLRRKSIRK